MNTETQRHRVILSSVSPCSEHKLIVATYLRLKNRRTEGCRKLPYTICASLPFFFPIIIILSKIFASPRLALRAWRPGGPCFKFPRLCVGSRAIRFTSSQSSSRLQYTFRPEALREPLTPEHHGATACPPCCRHQPFGLTLRRLKPRSRRCRTAQPP